MNMWAHVFLTLKLQALAVLAAMVFALPLQFEPLDHLELFSGKMAVSIAEMKDFFRGPAMRLKMVVLCGIFSASITLV